MRVGIAPATSCAAGLDVPAEEIARPHDCRTVLRATYTDASGALAVTVGIAVLRSTAAALTVASDLSIEHGGVRAVSFPGTRAAGFGERQRGWFYAEAFYAPYVFFYAAGFADGRHGTDSLTSEPQRLGSGVLTRLIAILTAGGPPCSRADIRC